MQMSNVQEKDMDGKYWSRSEKKQWSIALFLGCSALYACRTVMPLSIVSISKEMGWDKTESASVLSSFFWGYTMTQFLGGYLSDRIGGDVVVPIAACFWSVITFWTPQITYISDDKLLTLRMVIFSRVLLGMFQGVHMPTVTSLVGYFVPPEERSSFSGLVVAGTYAGTLLCGSVGSLLLETYGWRSVFYFLGVCGMTWMLFTRYCLINRHRQKYLNLPFVADQDSRIVKGLQKDSRSVPWITLFVKPAFWSLLIGHFCQNNAFYILLSWLPTYFHENFPDAKGWVFNVVPWIVTIPSSIFSGWLADGMIKKDFSITFVRKAIETVALLGTATFLVLLSYTSTYPGALFCMAMAVACSGFHNSGILVNPQDIAPKHAGSVFDILHITQGFLTNIAVRALFTASVGIPSLGALLLSPGNLEDNVVFLLVGNDGIMNMAGAIPGFVGVYLAGHILEVTKKWDAVFNWTAIVGVIGWVIYTAFGTGEQII